MNVYCKIIEKKKTRRKKAKKKSVKKRKQLQFFNDINELLFSVLLIFIIPHTRNYFIMIFQEKNLKNSVAQGLVHTSVLFLKF